MIKRLRRQDLKAVMTLLEHDKTYNIFIIGDIEAFGFDADFQPIYGEYSQDDLVSLLLIYHDNVCYYSLNDSFNTDYFKLLDQHGFRYISGHPKCLKPFIEHYPSLQEKYMYFCENKGNAGVTTHHLVQEAKTKESFEKIYDCLKTIDEFDVRTQDKAEFVQKKMSWLNKETCLYIEVGDTVVATATATSETAYNAMVVGVASRPNMRKLGYASDLINALNTVYIQDKGKSLCLFYDNPSAGSIYHRLGYQTIGQWLMLKRGIL